MDRLWAPWRSKYIVGDTREPGCVFCTKPQEDCDDANYILHRGNTCFVIMNLYPYNNGHLMVVPYRHVAEFETMDEDGTVEMLQETRQWIRVLKQAVNPQGLNVGMNLGQIAGAGISEHLHLHIVPRWSGDTNFMPVVGETKVISEGMDQTYSKLKEAYETIRTGT